MPLLTDEQKEVEAPVEMSEERKAELRVIAEQRIAALLANKHK